MDFDNRLLTYERTLTLELRTPNLHGLIYAAEIIVGPVLYPEKYKLHTGMRGMIANGTVGIPDLSCGYTNGTYKAFV